MHTHKRLTVKKSNRPSQVVILSSLYRCVSPSFLLNVIGCMYGRYPQELKILNSRLGRLTIMLVTDISHVGYVERRLYILTVW